MVRPASEVGIEQQESLVHVPDLAASENWCARLRTLIWFRYLPDSGTEPACAANDRFRRFTERGLLSI
jgi:hypothetical protein